MRLQNFTGGKNIISQEHAVALKCSSVFVAGDPPRCLGVYSSGHQIHCRTPARAVESLPFQPSTSHCSKPRLPKSFDRLAVGTYENEF
jgi:hypothetical protein